MSSIKEKMVEIIYSLPDDSTYEEILKELTFSFMVEKGLDDSRLNKTISNKEMINRIAEWHK
ncbi:MAG: hypothetical protein HQK91_11210 [Nitrospirae bacterium]|nr:hypothetical protein [Nitrospirota bacterium]MBF0542003.1 hypothetical protein [Nitrospirota bacterium]